MYMAYSNNSNLPRVRRQAVNLVLSGWSTVKVSRHFGFAQSTVVKWCQRASGDRREFIFTESSRPRHHPRELSEKIVRKILEVRKEKDQCAEVIHHRLLQEGTVVSLSSVKRTLKREGVTRFSKWKKWHQYPEKPRAEKPGILVQIDSMQEGRAVEHLRAYAGIDVFSRFGHVEVMERVNAWRSIRFVRAAEKHFPFAVSAVQSDHGSEFSKWFTKQCLAKGIEHHHSRVRTPTDNAYVERFIQTLQVQCLNRIPRSLKAWKKELPEFLHWYNTERPHMALGMRTPAEFLKTIPSY